MQQGVQHRMVLVVIFFRIFKIIFCFYVAILDLVHSVEAKFHLPQLLTASGNLF